jgi:lipopolysaccharide export system protein LptA
MRNLLQYFILLSVVLSTYHVQAQRTGKIKYKADDLFEFRKGGEKVRRLVGNVVFAQETSTMYCDSALYYVKGNIMEAYGHVRIVDDSVTITSKRLIYNGTDGTAKLRDNVVYTKGDQKLTTNNLDYNMDSEVGTYFNGGKLKDSINTLSSEIGYFYGKDNYALFWNGVELIAPEYKLRSDTLRYNTIPKVAISKGKTEIITEDDAVLHARGGEFRTQLDQSEFIEGNVETTDYYLEGDELFFDELKKYYDAKGNVKLTAKNEDIILTGDAGYADKTNNISKIYGNALMRRVLEKDTFYIAADTLVSIESKYDSAKRILAYNNVKMWRYNLQGVADSVSYFLHDSLMYFYKNPVFWNNKNQIEGDTIVMEIKNEKIKSMTLLQKAFLISEDTIKNYNQITGRTMKAYFGDSQISKIDVNGNGESIYYVLDEKNPNNIYVMGMNRIMCSDMTIRFRDQELDNITFYIKPEARFIPPHELTPDVQKLNGFNWRESERPKLEDLLKTKEKIKVNDDDKSNPVLPPKIKLDIEGIPKGKGSLLKNSKGDG